MTSSITPCSTPTYTSVKSDAVSNHSHPALLSGRLAANDFVMKCIEVRAVWWPVIWKFIWVSYIIALSDWRQWMLHGMSGLTQLTEKDNDQQNLSKVIVFDIAVYKTKSLQMSEDTVILFISS